VFKQHDTSVASCLQFAYGACELLFNPIKQWPTKGPFNSKFLAYMRNKNIRWYQKTSLLAYLSSYLVSQHAFMFQCCFALQCEPAIGGPAN
jgi:hypothetical protein